MADESLNLIGLSLDVSAHSPFWTRAVPVGSFRAVCLEDHKIPDRCALIAICRACALAMPGFVPIAPTRLSRAELIGYVTEQRTALGALIDRVGGRQETILTLESMIMAAPQLPDTGVGRDWLRRRAVAQREASVARRDLQALAEQLAAPAADLTEATVVNRYDVGCDLSLLHAPGDHVALGDRINAEIRAGADALSSVRAQLSGPFPPYTFVHLPPFRASVAQDTPG